MWTYYIFRIAYNQELKIPKVWNINLYCHQVFVFYWTFKNLKLSKIHCGSLHIKWNNTHSKVYLFKYNWLKICKDIHSDKFNFIWSVFLLKLLPATHSSINGGLSSLYIRQKEKNEEWVSSTNPKRSRFEK